MSSRRFPTRCEVTDSTDRVYMCGITSLALQNLAPQRWGCRSLLKRHFAVDSNNTMSMALHPWMSITLCLFTSATISVPPLLLWINVSSPRDHMHHLCFRWHNCGGHCATGQFQVKRVHIQRQWPWAGQPFQWGTNTTPILLLGVSKLHRASLSYAKYHKSILTLENDLT